MVARRAYSMSTPSCCPGGRMLMAKRAFSTSMTDRRGPLGADDDGEEGVLDVRLQLLPLEGNNDGEEGVLDVHAVGCPGGDC